MKKFDQYFNSRDSIALISFNIKAFCDDRGSKSYNESLSKMRASSVQKMLVAKFINSSLIQSSEGMGEIEIDSAGLPFEQQRKNNRRAQVEIVSLPKIKAESSLNITIKDSVKIALPKQKNLLTDSILVGDKITLENILFEGGLRKLLAVSYKSLDQLVATLKSKPQYHIMILGHVCCAEPGLDGIDNQTGIRNLSVVRAQTIYNYLVRNGIDEKRLQSKGMKGDSHTGLGDYYDRRVEIQITSINEK